MRSILENVITRYDYIMNEFGDKRTTNWLLMKSPFTPLAILVFYLYFCLLAGPKFMKDRKPFHLKYVLVIYNATQVIANLYILQQGVPIALSGDYDIRCMPLDMTDNPVALKLVYLGWCYLLCKFLDLLDTAFFVLRKKSGQITYLHLHHHVVMCIATWLSIKFAPGGHNGLLGLTNSFVHVVMYSYYLIASLGPQYQRYIWWKKYLTQLQIAQFVIVFVHNFQTFFRECDFPKWMIINNVINPIIFIYLFGKFYIRSYPSVSKEKLLSGNSLASKAKFT